MTLSSDDLKVVAACMRETADGYYDDREFQTLFGMTRSQMKSAAANVAAHLDAAVGALNNLLGYPHPKPVRQEFLNKLGVSEVRARQILQKLLAGASS